MKISIFNRVTQTKPIGIISISEFLDRVKHGYWKQEIEKLRSSTNKEEVRQLKKNTLQCVTISGVFTEHNQDSLVEHSGFLSIDFDNVDSASIEPLKHDKYTYALAMSASGNGYFAIVKINHEKHSESFKWLQRYYFKEFGLVVDEKPSNVASYRYISYDPNLLINEKSTIARFVVPAQKPLKRLPLAITGTDFEQYLKEICEKGIDISKGDYEIYYRIGFGLADKYQEQGRSYFHTICSPYEKYNYKECDRQYNYCLKNPRKGSSIGSVYFYMKEAGIDLKPSVTIKTLAFTKAQKEKGETKDSLKKTLKEVFDLDDEKSQLAYDECDNLELINGDELSPRELKDFVNSFVRNKYNPKFNLAKKRFECNGKEIERPFLNAVFDDVMDQVDSQKLKEAMIDRAIFSDDIEHYNPIEDFIEANRDINYEGSLKTLLEAYTLKDGIMTKLHADIFITRWLVGIIASLRGNVVRSVLTLIGPQNCGKSRWFRDLLPNELRNYYAESNFKNDKDDMIKMCENLIVVDDEGSNKSKKDEKQFKEYASKDYFTLRVPYGRGNVSLKRLAVLGMTSNETSVINDPTGNTRILPIHVNSFDHKKLNSINKTALFIELVNLYEQNVPYELTDDEFRVLSNSNDDFSHVVIEEELLLRYYEVPFDRADGVIRTTSEILLSIEKATEKKNIKAHTLGAMLRKHFGERKSITGGGKGYLVKEKQNLYDDIRGYKSKMELL